ncbi:PglL family O-oligosaccharyltransferase [Acinetobacter sp. YH12238]|uniref:PglL family O-oligosaccharyltransferase n=1 Tax=Acinetobacter sp. YH12238 TaxID=2601165 RepID=UPI0015D37C23|nr:O-antigen ligase family protein [Acinetobacter sp. YH12238]
MLPIYFCSFILFMLAWLLPNHYLPWLSVYQELCMFLAALLVVFCVSWKVKIKTPKIIAAVLLVSFIPFVQYFLGVNYYLGDALLIGLYLSTFILVFIAAYNLAELEEKIKKQWLFYIFLAFLIASIISVWLQLRQWFLLDGNIWVVDLPPNGRPFANVAQPNLLSTLLIVGLFSILYLYENRKIQNFTAGLSTLFILFGIALTFSRTAWLFFLVFLVWWLLKKWQLKYSPRLKNSQLIMWLSVFCIYLFFIPFVAEKIGLLSTNDIVSRSTSGLERIEMWKQLIAIIKQSPNLGYGWTQLNVAQMSAVGVSLAHPIWGYSHNVFLDFLVWNGIYVGGFLVVLILYFLLFNAIKVRSIDNVILMSVVGVIVLHSMLEYPFAYAFFLFPLAFMLGFCYRNNTDNNKSVIHNRIFFGSLNVAVIALILLTGYEYQKISKEYELMRYENVQLRAKDNQVESNKKYLVLESIYEYIWFVRYPLNKKMSELDLERAKKVTYSKPEQPVLYRYMQILILNGEFEQAHYILERYNVFFKQNLALNDINFNETTIISNNVTQ